MSSTDKLPGDTDVDLMVHILRNSCRRNTDLNIREYWERARMIDNSDSVKLSLLVYLK